MEEPPQPEQPDGDVLSHAAPPPAGAEQDTPPAGVEQKEEKIVDHLAVTSESSETSESTF